MANADGNYKVVLNGRYSGQAIVNILYYRLAFDVLPGDLNFAGASDLAFQVKQEIWNGGMKALTPNNYTLENITVYPYDNLFDLLYQLPYVLPVNEGATGGGPETNGPAPCVIVRFNLEPTSPLNGVYPPRRGYVALGPVLDSNIATTGYLLAGALAPYQAVANKMAANLVNTVPPAVFFPIRVKTVKVLGVARIVSWADVSSAVVRSLTSYRRSRMPE